MQQDIGNDRGDSAGDDVRDGAWLTYDQLAEARRISRRAAVRMTQRHRLRRQPGNDGHVRVWVPRDMLAPSQRASQDDGSGDDAPDVAPAFEVALAAVREAKDGEIAVLQAVIEAKNNELAAVRGVIDQERQRADAAEADRRQADTDRRDAEARADAAASRALAAEADRHAAETRAGAERARADVLDQMIATERTRADTAEGRAAELRDRLATTADALERAQGATDALHQADAARRARGLVARLRAAWRGE